ncbi:cellulose synthase operon protein YhjQ/BcsQ [Paracraurococcus lichenis]|uniref:Cellulose synthase operon protein YhjQ/BcsQ n=1 Tax=Paracraurococcus lichenis TaxID=3064888 RepID=A0ABT9EBJ7_9PROT|nr:cellulose synthase operon protein YhjQ/BcsQ [Paracraurococcus sp. LOR1-02]MDO9713568.1 cellulose synthase operon protein YhjQ/BcsQ [Paracraurococcus sp. LOR1-02]
MSMLIFASPKGGVGKTTLSAHVAAILAERGHQVIALDLDPQNSLRLHFGLPLTDEEGLLASLLRPGTPPWERLLRQTSAGVDVLPHGTMGPMETLQLSQMLLQRPALLASPVRDMLTRPGQILVVDTPPGPSPALRALLPLAKLLAVVLLADAASASLMPQLASGHFMGRGVLGARAAERAVLVLNQVDLGAPLPTAVLETAEQAMGDRLIGAISADPAVAEALADKQMLLSGSRAAEDLHALADAVVARLAPQLPTAASRTRNFAALYDWGLQ